MFWLLCLVAAAFAQTGMLKGRVTTADGQPAELVSVLLKGTGRGTLTDGQGRYELKRVGPGSYTLIASFTGLKQQEKQIAVLPGDTLTVDMVLEASSLELGEVRVNGDRETQVSTGLRLNVPLLETPQNITVTTSQTIRNIGALSLADVLRTASGVTGSGDKQDLSFTMRGTTAITNILRNGVGSGYWFDQEADAAMIERVEFVKGPAGFMISNSEPGGLINIVTKQPGHERIAHIGFGTGSYGLLRTTADLGGELNTNKKLTYRLNAGFQRQADFYQFGKFNKNFEALALKYEFDPRTSVTAEFNHMNSRQLSDGQHLPTINDRFFVLPDHFGAIDPNTPGVKASDDYYRLQFSHRLNGKWHINVQAAAVSGSWGGTMMFTEGVSAGYDTLYRYMGREDWKNKLYGVQAYLDGSFRTGSVVEHKILVGLDYGDLILHTTGGNTYGDHSRFYLLLNKPAYNIPVDSLNRVDQNPFDTKYENRYEALYLQDHIKFFNKVVLTLAGRLTNSVNTENYSEPEVVTDQKFIPRLGLTYLFTDQLSAYALYDGAFIPQNGRSFDGAVFQPLTGNNKEIGLKGRFFDRFNTSLAVYRITKNNALTSDPEHPGYQLQSGQLVSKGLEFDISGNILPNLNLFANYAYTDAKITEDNDPALIGLVNAGAVKHLASLFGRYTIRQSFGIGAGAAYAGGVSGGLDSYTNTFAGYLPSRLTFEGSLAYSRSRFSLNLNVYNLLNKRYALSGYRLSGNDWMYTPGAPRNFRLSLGVNF